jgi:DNA-binding transcriptional ArsR family regulator
VEKNKKKNKTDVFAAIGDPTRRKILMLLTASALSVQSIAENFDISRPAISKHIRILKEAGLIHVNQSGREHYCNLDPQGFVEIRDWLNFYEQFWKSKLASLEKVLHKNKKSRSS